MGSKIEVKKEDIEKIRELYEKNGESLAEIARQLGYPDGVIKRIVIEGEFVQGGKISVSYEELYRLYVKEEMNIKEVAKTLEIAPGRVEKLLRKYNIKARHVGLEPVGITKETLEDLYFNKNMKQKEIAQYFKCAVSTVSHYFIEYEIPSNPYRYQERKEISKVKITPEEEEELIQMCIQGKSTKEIAAYFGCSHSTVCRKLKAAGLSTKRYTLGDLPYDFFYKMCIVENQSIGDIAQMYHVNESTVKAQMRKVNFSCKKELQKIREKKASKETLEDLYFNKNMTEQQIAETLGIGRSYISRKFQEYGIKKEFKYDYITKEILEDLYVQQNIAPCYIAEKLKCPSNIVQTKIQKFNLRKKKTEREISEYRAKAYEKSLNTHRSKGEKEIEKLFPTPYHNIHSIINLELDLWYPEKDVAIEYNGDYWHSTDFPKNSGLHLAKLSICKNKKIHLINIFERDWHAAKSKKLITVHLTRTLTPEKLQKIQGGPKDYFIYETKQFENKYNLEGKGTGEKAVGIKDIHKNLIASLSYSIDNGNCIVSRFTTNSNYTEDYTTLISYLKEKEGLPIVLRCDNRYYNKFPCSLEPASTKEIEPKLFYVKSRRALRKEEASEEYLNHSKCRAVYDCGYTEFTF